jgi:hypothetical protein
MAPTAEGSRLVRGAAPRAVIALLVVLGLSSGAIDRSGAPSVTAADVLPTASPMLDAPHAGVIRDGVVRLGLGDHVVIDGRLSLSFTAVVEDSRCPTDVQCVWEGQATVEVAASAVGLEPATLGLSTHPDFGSVATYDGAAIELLDLLPYPTSTGLDGPYEVLLRVSHVPEASPPVGLPGPTPGSAGTSTPPG